MLECDSMNYIPVLGIECLRIKNKMFIYLLVFDGCDKILKVTKVMEKCHETKKI